VVGVRVVEGVAAQEVEVLDSAVGVVALLVV